MAKVESFSLDHDAVQAPYVRLAGREFGDKGDQISKFDLRFLQPNQAELPTGAMHTLEHLLAAYMRDYLDHIIDISPMGCRTGYYMVVWGAPTNEEVAKALKSALEDVVKSTWEDVQGTERKQCGNYRDHSLVGAHEYAKQVLADGISTDAFERQVV
ncbi:S-ribosylhomocysteine lyase [Aerococcus urinaehominis]|uniref:S-ribosylhomocysteine lyase n=1 Tax=Aerococcus urinaehominis TaxID=128944 RepID=A0A0X8FLK2_9LACT|nr:S-ribosylhomocysteine lyase [Aerococcus urinaehominis]AMB99462.1 S-ribosylhomocysteine lyase [Aerococcus urinaehominis]SDM28093.1 S-ribosylhomocysteine lyase /quorum-sensing autoinducer 2 (AI-2) synthesis protein LuxS [Aerococcus urinaehominis]